MEKLQQVKENILYDIRKRLGLENYLALHVSAEDPQRETKRMIIQNAWQKQEEIAKLIPVNGDTIPPDLAVLPDIIRVADNDVELRIFLIIPNKGIGAILPEGQKIIAKADHLMKLRNNRRGTRLGEIRTIFESDFLPDPNSFINEPGDIPPNA